MSDETLKTEEVCDRFASYEEPHKKQVDDHLTDVASFYRWLAEHDAAVLEEAANALSGRIGIQSTNGIGWIPANSLAGAARYLRHLARGPRA